MLTMSGTRLSSVRPAREIDAAGADCGAIPALRQCAGLCLRQGPLDAAPDAWPWRRPLRDRRRCNSRRGGGDTRAGGAGTASHIGHRHAGLHGLWERAHFLGRRPARSALHRGGHFNMRRRRERIRGHHHRRMPMPHRLCRLFGQNRVYFIPVAADSSLVTPYRMPRCLSRIS